MHRILLKLYHIQTALATHARDIKSQNETLAGLRQEQRAHNHELEGVRAEQARARNTVMQKEKQIKKAEKALEAKVQPPLGLFVHHTEMVCRTETKPSPA